MKKNTKEKPLITLTEINIGNSIESFTKFLDTQKNLFHSQVDQLQNIVVTQCRLTGVNPLSQEMAAGALSINIGKRPRDLLNPKGVKYMQSVFAVKDTISKKETREISALCGVTITQVKEFFASQRSRVRKHVRLSKDKAIKVEAAKASQEGCSMSSDQAVHVIDPTLPNSVDSVAKKSDAENALQGGCPTNSDDVMHVINITPLNSVDPKVAGDVPSSSSKEETVPGADDFEKKFIENIFNLMRKEESFSGQVKLMEWILKIQNSSVLYWFVTKGGLMMLAAWLNEAALEEQTTALQVIFQVLCHLPLHKAQPLQLSAMVPTVSRLRFYRTSDISNRAKVLLSRWSKLFIRSQTLKKPSPSVAAKNGKNISQSGALSNDWNSHFEIPEDILALALVGSEDCRKPENPPSLKLLESSDDVNKRNGRIQTKERRKVQLMEQPSRNCNGRSPQVTRTTFSNQGRPMSADDIQKAKLRATYMQNKHGKTGVAAANVVSRLKTENDPTKPSTSQIRPLLSPLKPLVRPTIVKPVPSLTPPEPTMKPVVPTPPEPTTKDVASSPPEPIMNPVVPTPPEPSLTPTEPTMQPVVSTQPEPIMKPIFCFSEESPTPLEPTLELVFSFPEASPIQPEVVEVKPVVVPMEASFTPPEPPVRSVALAPESCPAQPETTPMDSNPPCCMGPEESPWERLMRNKIPWHLPPELRSEWNVGVGENSKEVEVQTKRIGREKEIIYWRSQDIPPNPKEPWDFELDYDDTLTPQIPFEQANEDFPSETVTTSVTASVNNPSAAITTSISANNSENMAEPDLELLAVLLKNPHIVFALTSHQAGDLSTEDTVRLLDMIKSTGGELSQVINGLKEEEQSGSFPSPTPHSFPSPTPTPIPTSFPSPTPHSEYSMNGWRSEATHNSYQQYQGQTITPQQNQEYWVDNPHSQFYHHQEQARETTPQMNQNTNQTPRAAYNNYASTSSHHQPQQQPQEPISYRHVSESLTVSSYGQTVQPTPISIVMNLPNGTTPIAYPPPEDDRYRSYNPPSGSSSHPWPHPPNQNNYNTSFYDEAEPMRPFECNSWDYDEYEDYDMYSNSPRRMVERSSLPDYRGRRDHGRNPRHEWPRRRENGRRGRNKRWRGGDRRR